MEEIVFCKGGGCTAKLGPGILSAVLGKLPRQSVPELLVGFDSSDDAAVYRVSEDLAIVQTLDFFPPMVEDPYTFGQIAAANALSDVYAMGGEVKTALNIVCFPEKMDLNILGAVLQGGNDKVLEAGAVLVGGHSIQDDSVKYGLSVMGTIHPDRIYQNNTPQDGDALILTKALGVGLICTADRAKAASKAAMAAAIQSMTTLNKTAADVIRRHSVHAVTDVTGFGLLGHLKEMVADGFGAEIDSLMLPKLPEALQYAADFYITAAAQRNRNHVGDLVNFNGVPFAVEELLFDPQTSGGLLLSVPQPEAQSILEELHAAGVTAAAIIGRITRKHTKIQIW
ncbi:MAG: selenide, water dikinase SelD [Eubacteriales bacterium]|nr:selenide, water dikinase SelD [Eubacteriales bacterium]